MDFNAEIKKKNLAWVVNNVLPIHITGQIAGDRFSNERSGVAIPYLRGNPGIAKTSIIAEMCKNNGWLFIPTHLAMKPLEELGGLPKFTELSFNINNMTFNTTGTEWTAPAMCTMLYKISNQYPNTPIVWLLDDAHLWREEHQIMMFELMTYRKIKEFSIPDTVAVIMAGNLDTKAGARPLLSPVANRIAHYSVDMSYEEWYKNFALDAKYNTNDSEEMNNIQEKLSPYSSFQKINLDKIRYIAQGHFPIDYRISTFLKEFPQYFSMDEESDKPFPSPRTWTRLSNYVVLYEKYYNKKIPNNVLSYIAEAHVGPEPMSEFMKYVEIFSKINIEEDLKNAHKFNIPDNRVTQFAYAYLLGYTFIHDKNPLSKVDSYNIILQKFYDNSSHEMLFSALSQISYGDKEIKRNREEKEAFNEASMKIIKYAADHFDNFKDIISK